MEKKEVSALNREWLEYIERYLETRDPDYLIKAINKNPGLLKSSGRNLDVFEYLREKGEIKDETITYIDAPTVVWEAIKWWQNIHNWLGDEKESKEAKKYLLKIAPPLILPRQEIEKIITRDGFVHSLPKIKGKHPSLEYKSDVVGLYYALRSGKKRKRWIKVFYLLDTRTQVLVSEVIRGSPSGDSWGLSKLERNSPIRALMDRGV
ncbi:MAG: hypothetical protein KatS3mg078_1576 [Deltaproteobacteria bacterium]|nr:MAG: hypothetical protein KatS3mg078_1576 [Deltaproteobacteria bacterium]